MERIFPLHSPLVTKIEKIKSRPVRQSKLYFVRGLVGKKAKKAHEEKDYKMWEEAVAEEEIEKIEQEKKIEAEKKLEEKAKEKEQLEKKFEQAVSAHKVEEKKEDKK